MRGNLRDFIDEPQPTSVSKETSPATSTPRKKPKQKIVVETQDNIRPRSYKMLSQDKEDEQAIIRDYILGVPLRDIFIMYNVTKDAVYKALYAKGIGGKSTVQDILDLYGTVDEKNISGYLDLSERTIKLVLDTLEEAGELG